MIVSINQPAYLPWLGYFHRIAASDLHIVLDHVQFEKNSFANRNKIRTSNGWCWLSVPLKTSGRFGHLAINQTEIDNTQRWREKHWNSIRMNYSKAKYFVEHSLFFEAVFSGSWPLLNPLLRETTTYLLSALGIKTPALFSSEMRPIGQKSKLVLELCRSVGATHYLSGPLGRNYLDQNSFRDAGITVSYEDYQHPKYNQRHSEFEPFMSAIDLLFNCGCESSSILMRGQNPAIQFATTSSNHVLPVTLQSQKNS